MISTLTYFGLLATLNIDHFLSLISNFAATCQPKGSFLGWPTWYKYLDGEGTGLECVPKLTALSDIWLILLAVLEIMLRVAALAAVIYVLYSGIRFITSRGNAEKVASARTAVQDALIGLIIAVAAVAMVNFVGRTIQG